MWLVLVAGCTFGSAAGTGDGDGDGSATSATDGGSTPSPVTSAATASADGTSSNADGTVTDDGPQPTTNAVDDGGSATDSSTGSETGDADCELLWWSADFSVDPTTLDVNGDGIADWAMRDGGAFATGQLGGGTWTATDSRPFDSRPLDDFTVRTVVDVRMRALAEGGNGAVVWINVDYGATFAPLWTSVARDGQGGQTLVLYGKTDDATSVALHTVTGLGPALVDVTLDIDPNADEVQLWVAGNFEGTFAYPSFAVNGNDDRFVTLLDWGADAEFDQIDVSQCR